MHRVAASIISRPCKVARIGIFQNRARGYPCKFAYSARASSAWQLQRNGHQVTVNDRAAPGGGATAGNGAQLSYSYMAPLADASIWRQLPHLLLSPSSPLKLRPKLDPQQWRWGLAVLAACNAQTTASSTARLLALSAANRAVFDSVRAELPPDIDFSATGQLVRYRSANSLEHAPQQVDVQRDLGSAPQRLVSREEVIAIEPALAGYHRQIAGAVHTPSECAADCHKVCRALEQVLRGLCRNSAKRPSIAGRPAPIRKPASSTGSLQDINGVAVAIDRPVQVLSLAADLRVGLVHSPASTDQVLAPTKHSRQHRQHLDRPAVQRGVIDKDAALGHQLLDVAKAQRVGRLQPHAHQHHFQRVVHPLSHSSQRFKYLRTVKLHRLT